MSLQLETAKVALIAVCLSDHLLATRSQASPNGGAFLLPALQAVGTDVTEGSGMGSRGVVRGQCVCWSCLDAANKQALHH